MYTIGIDIGSSSIKAASIRTDTDEVLQRIQVPESEMPIQAAQAGWAEQDPELWWKYVCEACRSLISNSNIEADTIRAVGIAYQMHGLVLVDEKLNPLRPAIIWCDSRAISYGERAFHEIGQAKCLEKYLNSPGNFTAAKLKWVAEHEPQVYEKAKYLLLPGDYIALKLSGKANTTIGGLSEAILWDYQENRPAKEVMEAMGLRTDLIPEVAPMVGEQGLVNDEAAKQTNIPTGTPINYRAGDQPNNALSLGALEPGDVAATCGTSGVIYAVSNQLKADESQKTNAFAHLNYSKSMPHIGHLLCINGAGILHKWVRDIIAGQYLDYDQMEKMAEQVDIGSSGLSFLPFGNGAERMLNNKIIGAHLLNLDLNRHQKAHLIRAGLEGIAFAFVYGMRCMQKMGIGLKCIRAGNDNLFQSHIFAKTLATLTDTQIEIYETNGAIGAAKAAAISLASNVDPLDIIKQQNPIEIISPDAISKPYSRAYEQWLTNLNTIIDTHAN
ncbi:MAG: FGGY family carbohydrate kinase [Bacteroidota bacterium]